MDELILKNVLKRNLRVNRESHIKSRKGILISLNSIKKVMFFNILFVCICMYGSENRFSWSQVKTGNLKFYQTNRKRKKVDSMMLQT